MSKLIFPLILALILIGGVACQTSESKVEPSAKSPVRVSNEKVVAQHESLVFLAQEEKVAYDLYVQLGKKYNHRTFNNIQRSEARHMQAMNGLLASRQVADPNATLEAGRFKDAALQAMYDKLLKQGNVSLVAALRVGALVEEQDIADLSKHLSRANNAPDVVRVLTNLRRASYNHLDGFTSALEQETGTSYEPKILSAEVYKAARAKGAAHHKGEGKRGHHCEGEGESCQGCQGHE